MDLERRLERVDDDIGTLIRNTYHGMNSSQGLGDWEWYDALTTKLMEVEGVPYGVAERRVVDTFLDTYTWFRDEQPGLEEETRVYFSVATVANDILRENNDGVFDVYD